MKCVICGVGEIDNLGGDVCETCGWQDDAYQEKFRDDSNGMNTMSFNEAKAKWEATQEFLY
ncbi:MAG: hypothetical protein FWF59_08455 [Turicibacter sp.]|nr:hypothetical protein [Turicibacter sp.]